MSENNKDIVREIAEMIADMVMSDNYDEGMKEHNIGVLSEYFGIKSERIKELDDIFSEISDETGDYLGVICKINDLKLSNEIENRYIAFKVGEAIMFSYFFRNVDVMMNRFSDTVNELITGGIEIMNLKR